MRYLMGIQPFIVSKACQPYHWFPAMDRGGQILLQNRAKSASRQYHNLGTVSVPRSFTYMQLQSDQGALNSCGPVSLCFFRDNMKHPQSWVNTYSNIIQLIQLNLASILATFSAGSRDFWPMPKALVDVAPDHRSAEILWQGSARILLTRLRIVVASKPDIYGLVGEPQQVYYGFIYYGFDLYPKYLHSLRLRIYFFFSGDRTIYHQRHVFIPSRAGLGPKITLSIILLNGSTLVTTQPWWRLRKPFDLILRWSPPLKRTETATVSGLVILGITSWIIPVAGPVGKNGRSPGSPTWMRWSSKWIDQNHGLMYLDGLRWYTYITYILSKYMDPWWLFIIWLSYPFNQLIDEHHIIFYYWWNWCLSPNHELGKDIDVASDPD